jgi:hypothetical protein
MKDRLINFVLIYFVIVLGIGLLSGCVGPTGPAGQRGEQGPIGPSGTNGTNGTNGATTTTIIHNGISITKMQQRYVSGTIDSMIFAYVIITETKDYHSVSYYSTDGIVKGYISGEVWYRLTGTVDSSKGYDSKERTLSKTYNEYNQANLITLSSYANYDTTGALTSRYSTTYTYN